ncbi:MAG TPA: SAM-dependent methyltransferase [Acidimicrobiaceae bacterium]|nr:SAM-dependent methyltransferase [Acidimicrobiaceae bacterium]
MSEPVGAHVSERWAHWRARVDLSEYHSRWARMEAAGQTAHGEADLIEALWSRAGGDGAVLDAGCGMGRVAIELARRGIPVEGADLDDDLLAFARNDAPHITWHLADLATMQLATRYSMVAMPGNVMIFCSPDVRADVVERAAAHLHPGGLLVAGFSLDGITLDEYDRYCAAASLTLADRFATWEREPYDGGNYSVSVHRLVT